MANAIRRGKWQIAVLAIGTCVALNASAYTDGEVIAHFPFDTDYASIVNTDKNPGTFPTFGTVSLVSGGTKGPAVRTGRTFRVNSGYLETSDGRLAIDLSAFGIDESVTTMTIEFFVKMSTAEVAEWARQVTFGIGGENANGTGNLGSSTVPFHLDLSRQADHVYAKMRHYVGTGVSGDKTIYSSNITPYDGGWHHLAFTYTIGWQSQSIMYCYLDHKQLGDGAWSGQGNNWHGITPGAGQKLWLYLGAQQSGVKCRFDEFRITNGVLPPEKFLDVVSDTDVPVDGETLSYLPLDNSIESVAHAEWAPSLLSGSLAYDADVWKTYVGTKDHTAVVRTENLACVKCGTATKAKVDLPYWALQEGQLESATIEFFIRGLGTEQDWGTPMTIEGGGNGFPLLVQIPTGQFYMRMDACKLVEGKTANANGYVSCNFYVPIDKGTPIDGRWHHMAFTVAPRASGESEIKFYFDYAPIASFWSGDYAWRGLRAGDCLNLAKNCGINIDEFRITKGVLPVGKFLKARDVGMMLIFR